MSNYPVEFPSGADLSLIDATFPEDGPQPPEDQRALCAAYVRLHYLIYAHGFGKEESLQAESVLCILQRLLTDESADWLFVYCDYGS